MFKDLRLLAGSNLIIVSVRFHMILTSKSFQRFGNDTTRIIINIITQALSFIKFDNPINIQHNLALTAIGVPSLETQNPL